MQHQLNLSMSHQRSCLDTAVYTVVCGSLVSYPDSHVHPPEKRVWSLSKDFLVVLSQHVRKTGKPIRTLVRNKSCDIKTRSDHRPIPGSWNRSIIVEAAKVSVCACASSSVARMQPEKTSVLVPRLSRTKLFDRDVVRGVITEASGLRLQTSDKRTAPSDRTICFGPRCIRFTSHW